MSPPSKFGDPSLILKNKQLCAQQALDDIAGIEKTYSVLLEYTVVVSIEEKDSKMFTTKAESASEATFKAEEKLLNYLGDVDDLHVTKATVVDIEDPTPKDTLTTDMFKR